MIPIKDNDTVIHAINKEGVTNWMVIKVSYIKSRICNTKNRDLQTKCRKFLYKIQRSFVRVRKESEELVHFTN